MKTRLVIIFSLVVIMLIGFGVFKLKTDLEKPVAGFLSMAGAGETMGSELFDFSDYKGNSCLGRFIERVFYPNPEKLGEVKDMAKNIKSGFSYQPGVTKEQEELILVYFEGVDLSPYAQGDNWIKTGTGAVNSTITYK